jgi:hypothetical protein
MSRASVEAPFPALSAPMEVFANFFGAVAIHAAFASTAATRTQILSRDAVGAPGEGRCRSAAERAITTERGGMRTERRRTFLRKSEFRATPYPIARPNPRLVGRPAAGRKERGFFYCFRRNPLKNPDSDE